MTPFGTASECPAAGPPGWMCSRKTSRLAESICRTDCFSCDDSASASFGPKADLLPNRNRSPARIVLVFPVNSNQPGEPTDPLANTRVYLAAEPRNRPASGEQPILRGEIPIESSMPSEFAVASDKIQRRYSPDERCVWFSAKERNISRSYALSFDGPLPIFSERVIEPAEPPVRWKDAFHLRIFIEARQHQTRLPLGSS